MSKATKRKSSSALTVPAHSLKDATAISVVVSNLESRAKSAINKLKKVDRIKTKEEYALVGDNLKFIKMIKSEAKKEKDAALAGIKSTEKWIRDHFRPFENKVNALEEEYKQKLLDFTDRQEKKLLKLQEDFSKGKTSIGSFSNKAESLEVTGAGSAKVAHINDVEIVDKKKIPLKFMEPDISAIKDALLSGETVPGCKLIKRKSIRI